MSTGYLVPDPQRISPKATVEANAADATLTVANMGKIETNTGASGAVVLTLPSAAVCGGTGFKIQVTVAQIVKATPISGEKVYLGGSGVASKYFQVAGVIGNYADLYSDGVDWLVLDYSGVCTKEA